MLFSMTSLSITERRSLWRKWREQMPRLILDQQQITSGLWLR